MAHEGFIHQLPDNDPVETLEWIESLDSVISTQGIERARYVLLRLLERARNLGVGIGGSLTTPYVNTIPVESQTAYPGDLVVERSIRAAVRWNAVAMVDRANHRFNGLGGHLSTYASAASLYEVGFNHFFRGPEVSGGGDQVFFQGHASPGIYARAFLEHRLTPERLDGFRRQASVRGLPSYPHPRRMPDFWQFPTVSMGLGPLNAVAQARFNRYLSQRGIIDVSDARVWCFVGDGEMDEPESLAAIAIAGRESLENLIFVVNCNLQRLDGPVRGNSKVIQEFESLYSGAGWSVIKAIWGSGWDPLLAEDSEGVLVNRMNEVPDGEFQRYSVEAGSYIREQFFGSDPRLLSLVANLSDEDLERLPRGGHDFDKIFNAYARAMELNGKPTVVLAKTVKGWALGDNVEGRNATHQIKKLSKVDLLALRDRLAIPVSDSEFEDGLAPYFRFEKGSEEFEYLAEKRNMLGGWIPQRRSVSVPLAMPDDEVFEEFKQGSPEGSTASTTTAFTRLLRRLLSDPGIGDRIVPVIPDEARTFGMDALFREFKIHAPFGQKYEPVDASLLLSYREATDGQILEEGINEAGAIAMFTAAGTSYSTHGTPMIPFFSFYSMFGFQRVADLVWAFSDQLGRGFMLGATAGRTTLEGEGLQHCDGQSQLLASAFPNCRAYDPAFAYETAVIVRDGISRMYGEAQEDCFYYLTLYNENILMPAQPDGVEDGIIKGLYCLTPSADSTKALSATIVASGSAVPNALLASEILRDKYGVDADVWSATSWKALRDDALEIERWNRLHPGEARRTPFVAQCLASGEGPVLAVSDWMHSVSDQIARWIPRHFISLGTDGFGHSDTRDELRRHFEVDAQHQVVAVLSALADGFGLDPSVVLSAIEEFGINPDALDPRLA